MKFKQLFRLALVILVTYIIFNFSLQPAEISNEQSGLFVRIAYYIIRNTNWNVELNVMTHIIRKLAHFSEYGLLGVCTSWFIHSLDFKKTNKYLYTYGIIVPIIDELIQSQVPGRSCQVSDMLLDMSGYATGCLFILLIYFLIKKHAEK